MKSIRNVLLGAACLLLVSLSRAEVVELTDATFEHQTQASTGMTTGSWFIMFKAAKCPHCEKAAPEFEELSNDQDLSERGIVFATVDVPSNRATSTRFGIRGFPSLLYLHKGQLYQVPGKRTAESWKHFLTEGIEDAPGKPIPPPVSAFETFVKTLKAAGRELADAATGKSGKEGYFIVLMVLILVFVMGGLVLMCFLPAQKTKVKKKQQ